MYSPYKSLVTVIVGGKFPTHVYFDEHQECNGLAFVWASKEFNSDSPNTFCNSMTWSYGHLQEFKVPNFNNVTIPEPLNVIYLKWLSHFRGLKEIKSDWYLCMDSFYLGATKGTEKFPDGLFDEFRKI